MSDYSGRCDVDEIEDRYEAERHVLELVEVAAAARTQALPVLFEVGAVSEREYLSGKTTARVDLDDSHEKLKTLRGRKLGEQVSACKSCPGRCGCPHSMSDLKLT